MTTDGDIKFMASACIFGLSQSPELCSDIAESGAADQALEDLAHCRPGEESEFLLAQLAVVAQMAGEPRFSRRLKSPATVDLLMRLALGGSGEEVHAVAKIVEEGDGAAAGGDGPTATTTTNQTDEGKTDAPDGGRHHEAHNSADGNNNRLVPDEKRGSATTTAVTATGFHADSAGVINSDWVAGGGGANDGGAVESTSHAQQLLVPLPKIKIASAMNVKVASAYMGALRYCVVTIAERLGSTLDQSADVGRPLSPWEWDVTNTVVSDKLRGGGYRYHNSQEMPNIWIGGGILCLSAFHSEV